MSDLNDKVVLITGASSGIGEATARLLAAAGARVVIGARRTDRLEALAREIRAAGGQVLVRPLDVTSLADMQAFVDAAHAEFGRIDVIVNNAGVMPLSPLAALKVREWDAMIDVNIRGVLYGIAAALPVFQHQGSGHVINIVSTAGLRIVPAQGVYAATKNAVRTLTEALRQEAGPTLRVTEISPGFVATEFASSNTDASTRAAVEKQMGEMAIGPDAIARCIALVVEQPREVDVGTIVVRPTAQG